MARDPQSVRDTIRGYVLRVLLPGESPDNLEDALSLKEAGILDSMTTLDFVTFVEETYGIEIAPHEASGAFDRIDDIVDLVLQKS
jgi:acyl carrier protein